MSFSRMSLDCRGRDATIAKIKDCYYWPNYYKEIKGKVTLLLIVLAIHYYGLSAL